MKFTFLLSFASFFLGCQAQNNKGLATNEDNNTLLWEISGKNLKQPSYLFGTFHLMCKEDINFSANLQAAMKAADEVYFEMDLDDPANTLGALFLMNMKEGTTLKDLYTEEEFARLNNFFKDSLSMPMAMLQKMKPLFLEALLYPKLMDCKNMSGIEQELLAMAQKDKKEIKGFETMAFQASVFDSIPYKTQASSLLKTIDSLSTYKVYFAKMLEVYKTQKIDSIQSLFSESEYGQAENMDILLTKRNQNWVEQLKTILKTKSVFIAVGAAHLVGDDGLITLLRKEGYTLTPIQNNQD